MPSGRRHTKLLVLGAVIVLLVALRVALPWIVLTYLNDTLAKQPVYRGHIADVDIALYRGAYTIDELVITKVDGKSPLPFARIQRIDLSVAWGALLKGQIVAEVELHAPRLNVVNGPTAATDQAGTEVDWRDQVQQLVPLDINRFAVYDGEAHYVELVSETSDKAKVDVMVDQIRIEARNLTNSEKLSGTLVATVEASARPLQLGRLDLRATVDPYADAPTFDLDAEMKGVPIPRLNDLLRSHAFVDVEAGTLDVFTELAASDGKFEGYVKPHFTGMKVVDLKKEIERDEEGPLRVAWEVLIGGVRGLLENDETGRIALKVPLSGSLDNPQVGTWAAIGTALRNAFIEALFRGIDNDVSIAYGGKGARVQVADDARSEEGRKNAENNSEKKGLFGKKKAVASD